MNGWKDAMVGMDQAGIIGHPQYTAAQDTRSRQAALMLNVLSLDAKVRRNVDEAKRLLQDITMSERRVHASNVEISTGMGDSTHLMRQRAGLLKVLDELIHLTGNDRIAEFRCGCLTYLDALARRRDIASKYRHGQAGMVLTVTAERQIDELLERLLEFVAADFGAKPEPKVKPRRGILRSLLPPMFDVLVQSRLDPLDPTEWYKRFDFSRA
jgi:hypothetical protein